MRRRLLPVILCIALLVSSFIGTSITNPQAVIAAEGSSPGDVWAWGSNNNGQLGNNTLIDSQLPIEVSGASGSGYLTDVKQSMAVSVIA